MSGGATPEPVLLHELLQRPRAELEAAAMRLGLSPAPGLRHDELAAAVVTGELARGTPAFLDGHLAVLPEGYAFVRFAARSYAPTALDAYVSASQVRSLNLLDGHRVRGPVRGPKGTERHFALLQIDAVDGAPAAALARRVPFADRVPLVATRRLALAAAAGDGVRDADANGELRTLELLAPWCHGHRVLVAAPPTWPAAAFLVRLARALEHGHRAVLGAPDLRIAMCLLDQRPEDIASAQRALAAMGGCDVVATPFAAAPEQHLALADAALQRAQREVEAGADVVLLIDSLTALVRAKQRLAPPAGGFVAPGLPAAALLPAKQLFAAARECGEGGSLTIVATAAIDTGSPVDDAIARELAWHTNSDVVVDGALAAAAAAVPFDLLRTRTRAEDDPRPPHERDALRAARAVLADLPPLVRHRAWLACLADAVELDALAGRLAACG